MVDDAKFWSAWIAGFALLLTALPVDAQEVRRYGDDQSSESSSGGGGGGGQGQSRPYYPGQPMPQSNQQSEQTTRQTRTRKRQSGKKKKEGEQVTESYSIRIHEPGELPERRSLRTQQTKTTSEPLNKPPEKMYQGVIPGERDSVEHLKRDQESGRERSKPNKLTWIGFQAKDDKTRVFVQTARKVRYSTDREENGTVVVVRLENTEISARNFRRRIDASRFDRVVEQIEATEESGDGTVLRIKLRSAASPSIELSDTYLYLDFPHQSADDDGVDEAEE